MSTVERRQCTAERYRGRSPVSRDRVVEQNQRLLNLCDMSALGVWLNVRGIRNGCRFELLVARE